MLKSWSEIWQIITQMHVPDTARPRDTHVSKKHFRNHFLSISNPSKNFSSLGLSMSETDTWFQKWQLSLLSVHNIFVILILWFFLWVSLLWICMSFIFVDYFCESHFVDNCFESFLWRIFVSYLCGFYSESYFFGFFKAHFVYHFCQSLFCGFFCQFFVYHVLVIFLWASQKRASTNFWNFYFSHL